MLFSDVEPLVSAISVCTDIVHDYEKVSEDCFVHYLARPFRLQQLAYVVSKEFRM